MVEAEFLRPPPLLLNCTERSDGERENPEAPRHHDRSYNTFPAKAGAENRERGATGSARVHGGMACVFQLDRCQRLATSRLGGASGFEPPI